MAIYVKDGGGLKNVVRLGEYEYKVNKSPSKVYVKDNNQLKLLYNREPVVFEVDSSNTEFVYIDKNYLLGINNFGKFKGKKYNNNLLDNNINLKHNNYKVELLSNINTDSSFSYNSFNKPLGLDAKYFHKYTGYRYLTIEFRVYDQLILYKLVSKISNYVSGLLFDYYNYYSDPVLHQISLNVISSLKNNYINNNLNDDQYFNGSPKLHNFKVTFSSDYTF